MEVIENAALAKVIDAGGLDAAAADRLLLTFTPSFMAAKTIIDSVEGLTVTDATQLSEMERARKARLALVPIRTAADRLRKAEKDQYARAAKGVDNVAHVIIREMCEPTEARLQEMEDFAKRAEAERKAKFKASRGEALAAFVQDVSIYPLGEMTEAAWSQLLDGSRAAHEARIEAERKAEADRLAAIEAKRLEDARIRAENERLAAEAKAERERAAAVEAKARKERDEAEAAARAAKAEADAVLAKERKAREEAEAAARAERDAAAAKAKAEADAKAKAAAAPDVDKLLALADLFESVEFPNVATDGAVRVMESVSGMRSRLVEYIRTHSKAI